MSENGAGTYERILGDLLDARVIHPADRILVQFAGAFDADVTRRLGLRRCHFSNLAPESASSRLPGAHRADAHRMAHPDGSFDHVIGHAGLHHCSRPHEALHEMYRIATTTVVAVENQDSALMRLAERAGLVGCFERQAVADGGGTTGGVDGTGVPNHVYRWTRREVRKTVASFDPGRDTPVEFHTRWLIGTDRALTPSMRGLVGSRRHVAAALTGVLNGVTPGQGNIFGFTIRKDLAVARPWISDADLAGGSAAADVLAVAS